MEVIVDEVLGKVRQQECQQAILRCLGQMIGKYKINLEFNAMQNWLNAQ